MSATPVDRIRELGGEVFLCDGRLKYRIPAHDPEARQLLAQIRRDRDAVVALLRAAESKPPSLQEVTAMLPPGVELVRYEPRDVPFAVNPISVVVDAGRFFRVYLRELRRRVAHPKTRATAPLAEILSKLSDGGLEVRLSDAG